jgi:predicted permease
MKIIRRWLRRRAVEQQMREEMEFHLDARIADLVRRGLPPEQAARTARLEFGNAEAHREECRAALGYRLWDELRADLRFAARGLRSQPGYSAAAIAILALAIGANSSFFALFFQHVLKPLPVRGAERHFDLQGLDGRARSTGNWTPTEIDALRQASREQLEGLYSNRTIQVLLLEPEQRLGAISFVSANYFRLLGGSAAAGRTFSDAEQREAVAVLSHSGQRRLFANDPAPLGKKLRVRTTLLTVIGVMPSEFTGTVPIVPDFWVGAEMDAALLGSDPAREPRYSLSGLLAPGVSLRQAEAALTTAASAFPRPGGESVARVELQSRSAFVAADAGLLTAAGLVFAAFLTVLLIACANLANLCLARAASRTHEIATRLSLGASRARIVRQLLTESTFVALLGAAGGIVLAVLAVQQAQGYLATFAAGMGIVVLPVDADGSLLLFSAGLGVIAGLAFGLLPAIEVTSPSLTLSAKRGHSLFAGRVRPRRLRNLLIASQVASSLVLLLVAGILVRHIQSLNAVSPGYDLDRLFDLRLDRPQPGLLALLEQQRLIAGVSAVERVPLYGAMNQHSATAGGRSVRLSYNHVDHRYFETLALPVEGRAFTAQEAALNAKVLVISQATARRLWPGESPFGQSISIDPPQTEKPREQRQAGDAPAAGFYQVVGVAPDVISGWLFRGPDATAVYFPAAAGQSQIQSAIVRINGPRAPAIAEIRKLCASAADATGCEPTSLREVSGLWGFVFEAAASVAGALGMLALLLTAVGLYGVTSYSVVQRRREIGVHLALGASPTQVVRRILREAWRCVVTGLAVGLPVCLILSRLMKASVFGVQAFDPTAYLLVPALLALITTLACAVPARRAAKMDPMDSLREE